jgi:hypothetical protein
MKGNVRRKRHQMTKVGDRKKERNEDGGVWWVKTKITFGWAEEASLALPAEETSSNGTTGRQQRSDAGLGPGRSRIWRLALL